MYKRLTIILTLFVFGLVANAQWHYRSAGDTSHYCFRFSTGTMMESGFGKSDVKMWIAPAIEYRPNGKLTIKGGFAAVGSMLGSYELHGTAPRSLAPRKRGTRLGAVHVTAEYQANDHLWIWGSIAYLQGQFEPLWLDDAHHIQATALSGGFGYRFDNGNRLEMGFSFIRSQGLNPLWTADPYYYGYYGAPITPGLSGAFGLPMYY